MLSRLRCMLLLGIVFDLNGNFNFYVGSSSYGFSASSFFLSTFIMPFFVRSLLRFCDVSFLFRSHHCFCFLCRFHFLTFSFVHFQRETKKKQNEKENSIENRTIFVIALNVEYMQA